MGDRKPIFGVRSSRTTVSSGAGAGEGSCFWVSRSQSKAARTRASPCGRLRRARNAEENFSLAETASEAVPPAAFLAANTRRLVSKSAFQ